MTVTDPLTAVPLEMRPLIEGVADRLQQDFSGIFSSETIQRYMAESWDQLSGAKVAAFVPLPSSGSAGSGSALARVGSSCSGSSVQDAQPSCPSRSALHRCGVLLHVSTSFANPVVTFARMFLGTRSRGPRRPRCLASSRSRSWAP